MLRPTVTSQERQTLVRYGRPLGAAIKDLVSIVTPRTFARWLQGERQTRAKPGQQPAAPGRPRTADEVKELVLRLARETGWGYTRILGELHKLGIHSVSRSTVVNLLREHGLEPGPKRGSGSWDQFIKRHLATLWACDFFSVRAWTLGGVVELYVLFFLHVGSRKVDLAAVTAQPDAAWVEQQARNLAIVLGETGERPTHLLRDHDSKFTRHFDEILASEGIEVKPVGPRAPNMNPHAERFVQSARQECLDHFVFFGEAHLGHVLDEYLVYYNTERPHQGVGNVPLSGEVHEVTELLPPADVVCEERLGGLLKHYRRAA